MNKMVCFDMDGTIADLYCASETQGAGLGNPGD